MGDCFSLTKVIKAVVALRGAALQPHAFLEVDEERAAKKLPGTLEEQIKRDLGSYDEFAPISLLPARRSSAPAGHGCLALRRQADLIQTPDGENPLVHGGTPILGVDVWEHSYTSTTATRGRIPRGLGRQPDQLGLRA